jgi:hypothetical protein
MNVSSRVSQLSRMLSACGLRLTIAVPLLIAALHISGANAQPPIATLPTIAHNHGDSESDESDHDGMHDDEMDHDESDHDGMHDDEMDHGEYDHGDMNHQDMHGEHESHGHSSIEVDATQPIPQVSIAIVADSASGWNLEITTTNFEFSGATVGQANSPNQGHAHLYANGEKIARVYGNWYHIPQLPSGEVTLEVVLNSNQHQALTYNGTPIAAAEVVTIP